MDRDVEASLSSKSTQFVNKQGPSPFNSETALQSRKLQQEKEATVREKKFDLAKQIKETVDHFK